MLIDAALITFAHSLADAAGAAIRPYFGAHGEVEAKGDNSPVTAADRAAEAAIRALIEQHYPTHSIYGEEFGIQLVGTANEARVAFHGEPLAAGVSEAKGTRSPSAKNYTWVIDPIDGTRAFIAGRKEWGTLIALCEDGVPILGVLDQPITGERWLGVKGQPTVYSQVPVHAQDTTTRAGEVTIRTRACPALDQAEFSTTSAAYFTPVQAKQVVALAQACRAAVKDGDCYAYGLLARGERDLVIDAGLKPYDILALVPIIEGAGGKITGWDNETVTLTNFANVLAAGDAKLHKAASEILAAARA